MHLYVGIDLFFISVSLPCFIKGFLKKDREIYYIYINSDLSTEEQMRTAKHEYMHLIKNDFEDDDLTKDIERRNYE